eukprot:COSAG06_NODE_6523_length_2895_cov_63.561516_5_plen_144_part_00
MQYILSRSVFSMNDAIVIHLARAGAAHPYPSTRAAAAWLSPRLDCFLCSGRSAHLTPTMRSLCRALLAPLLLAATSAKIIQITESLAEVAAQAEPGDTLVFAARKGSWRPQRAEGLRGSCHSLCVAGIVGCRTRHSPQPVNAL